ncbi:Hint domain-containing protein [Phaeovulum vinaykumarii]|uniref:Hint domain-containing protein n=2 Tax=Phaeovulum vinaykumarii TaxID=407234 RepID=A0A1N7JK04_9RHOB|nr:Hint domain-containing protein [Phaeovulum vinaykumarii]SIS49657.1 Hint domain-containing protein [Phaeovulum vinaykumarii]SOB89822.1 Hint domain-containing protein [Phaeovulum vinaykumarii]
MNLLSASAALTPDPAETDDLLDPDPACTPAFGIGYNIPLLTPDGPRPAASIAPGDAILTFDNGFQKVSSVERVGYCKPRAPLPPTLWPLLVPAGTVGDNVETLLAPEQGVMVESDVAEALFGDPFVVVPAAALDGEAGIHRVPPSAQARFIVLHFDRAEVVVTQHGGLLMCPPRNPGMIWETPEDDARPLEYTVLPLLDALELIAAERGSETALLAQFERRSGDISAALIHAKKP